MKNIITRRELIKLMNGSVKDMVKNCKNKVSLEEFLKETETTVSEPKALDPSNENDRKVIEELEDMIKKEGRTC